MNFNFLREIELHFLCLDIATFKYKIMEILQIAMISLPNSSQMLISINYITPSLFSKLLCIKMHKKLYSKSKILTTLIEFYNYKLLFSMSLKKFNMQSLLFHKCLQMHRKLLQHKVVYYIKKKNLTRQNKNSLRLIISLDINVTSLTILLYVTINLNSWRRV